MSRADWHDLRSDGCVVSPAFLTVPIPAEGAHLVLVRLAPDRFGLRLHPGDAVEDRDRAIQHTQAALHLEREVHVKSTGQDFS